MRPLLLGAHMSSAGGVTRALERGQSIHCSTIQIFTKNANRWLANSLEEDEIRAFRKARKETAINPVFAHCSYLINLASSGPFYEKSIQALIAEIRRAEHLGLDFIVLHPGAHMGIGEREGLQRIVDALDQAIGETSRAKCKIAIENTAGQGTCLGCSFSHLEYIVQHVRKPGRIGFCIDTCHLFAAGYDIRSKRKYQETFRQLFHSIPPKNLLAFHLNDSKKPIGSRVDRHEHIGKGFIGVEAFRYLLNDVRFEKIPKVLETPKGKDMAEDVQNLNLLRSLVRW